MTSSKLRGAEAHRTSAASSGNGNCLGATAFVDDEAFAVTDGDIGGCPIA
jgi:hypothetical protein